MNSGTSAQEERATYYCKVDTYNAVKDYQRGGRCVRLIGISETEYWRRENGDGMKDGLTTYTVDIDAWLFLQRLQDFTHRRQVTAGLISGFGNNGGDQETADKWIRLVFNLASGGDGYLYPTFSEESPQYFSLLEVKKISSGLRAPPSQTPPSSSALLDVPWGSRTSPRSNGLASKTSPTGPFHFFAFHVGQGMCSVVHNKRDGVVLDIGAGAPITRQAFLKGGITNELTPLVTSLSNVALVISHGDADHWRMMAWDTKLRDKIETIYVPGGADTLALEDKVIKGRVVRTNDRNFRLDAKSNLRVLRSAPKNSDRNGECLVCVFTREENRVLVAGDYVYKRMKRDGNRKIRSLLQQLFSAIVVPHHGDSASADDVPRPQKGAKAFFSAGTHKGYNHPTIESQDEHKKAGFENISDKIHAHITKIPLTK